MAEDLPLLPPSIQLETPAVLKKAARAHRFLAELKGRCRAIPNQGILISTLALQEAKDSSEIENIVTTRMSSFATISRPLPPPASRPRRSGIILRPSVLASSWSVIGASSPRMI
jgi:hypothetical protein